MKKIQTVSRFFYYFFIVMMIAWALIYIDFWMHMPSRLNLAHIISMSFIPAVKILHPLNAGERFIGFMIGLIPMLIDLYVMYCLVSLFKLYRCAKIFTLKNIYYIRHIAYFLLLG